MNFRISTSVFFAVLLLVACDTKTTTVNSCGDGFLDTGEQCDGDVGENTCASLGHYNHLGTLTCRPDCQFELSLCGGRCGDGNADGADGEDCDGADLNGNSCQTLGASGGDLACRVDCTFDTTGCTNVCGNGLVEGEEACDDTGTQSGDGCSADCTVEAGWDCDGASPSVCAPICGDGLIVGNEQCDGTNLDGSTCLSLGFHDGTLACDTLNCAFDTQSCELAGRCGDGELQTEYEEVCDGQNLDENDCMDRGFYGGTLACASDCRSFVETGCVGRCGDGVAQTGDGELCDGADLTGSTCQSLGYHGGALACNATCDSFDLTSCTAVGRCGDGLLQQAFGEQCDGAEYGSETCQTQGFYTGTLTCGADCVIGTSGCSGLCGDNVMNGIEQCDGGDLNSNTCTTLGYYSGSLACNGSCYFDLSGCSGFCGDGVLNGSEACDGTQFGGKTCGTYNYYTGSLTCRGNCTVDPSGCSQFCGDGAINGPEVCDGAAFNTTCAAQGHTYGGSLTCINTCSQVSTASCNGYCGDGVVQGAYGEQCDGTNLNGNTCVTLGYFGGTLGCSSCGFNVSGCLGVTRVTTGQLHACALISDGTVRCWGYNNEGQLGDGTTSTRTRPVTVSGLTGVTVLFAGGRHTCARLSDGTVKCWGRNNYGQLGDNSTTNRYTPVTVSGLTGATSLGLGDEHSCAMASGVKCWGRNNYGQLGDGTITNRYTPVAVTGLTSPVGVAAGYSHSCAYSLTAVRCWGRNQQGQLGNGTTTDSLSPVTVTGVGSPRGLALNANHSCAAVNGVSGYLVYCWGYNANGQLGDGTTTSRSTAAQIIGLESSGITAGSDSVSGSGHTCSVRGGIVKCWGKNTYGQLGNNTTADSSTPSSVMVLSDAIGRASCRERV